ncbi:MAG: hypothetical protein ACXWQE_03250, partial [Bdellovibrionales bacterium]
SRMKFFIVNRIIGSRKTWGILKFFARRALDHGLECAPLNLKFFWRPKNIMHAATAPGRKYEK